MLPKSKRLTVSDFKGLKTRIIYRGAYFDVASVPKEATKYACIIAKKRIKRAVDRNKARRKVHEALRAVETKEPSYILIYPHKQILLSRPEDIKKELMTAFATL